MEISAVGMIRENADDTHLENSADEEASQRASSIGWVNKNPVVHSWDSSSSDGWGLHGNGNKTQTVHGVKSRWGTVAD